jgi:hypothetical protein
VNALARPEVGKYLNRAFVSTYQKVGTFRLAGNQKQGGNVASYFCTADGHVLHAIAGPVDGNTLLREARWAVETYKLARLEARDDDARLRLFFLKAHSDMLKQQYGLDLDAPTRPRRRLDNAGRVHLVLAASGLPRIEQVYQLVFEKVLNEKVSTAPVVQNGG